MSNNSTEILVLTDAATPREARAAAERVLSGRYSDARLADILIVISELVTNALAHTGGACNLVIHRFDQCVVVEVHDDDIPARTQQSRRAGDLLGRGLGVVQTLAERWGIERLDTGKCVWAEFKTSDAD